MCGCGFRCCACLSLPGRAPLVGRSECRGPMLDIQPFLKKKGGGQIKYYLLVTCVLGFSIYKAPLCIISQRPLEWRKFVGAPGEA